MVYFRGPKGPLLPQTVVEKVGAKPPHLFQWVLRQEGPLRPQKSTISVPEALLSHLKYTRGPGCTRDPGTSGTPGAPETRVYPGPGYTRVPNTPGPPTPGTRIYPGPGYIRVPGTHRNLGLDLKMSKSTPGAILGRFGPTDQSERFQKRSQTGPGGGGVANRTSGLYPGMGKSGHIQEYKGTSSESSIRV
jgi:hypothetical protein